MVKYSIIKDHSLGVTIIIHNRSIISKKRPCARYIKNEDFGKYGFIL